ncbi:hypothetical protein [Cellulosimicrobium arenosum]|uniref:Uncharacterized protein n=1 Tax=Cellulosimicrobium arenosum TaxID=2708133 RepID=A0A927PE57_9MICO|nr:hypothetical protein [Cellulosimicrobium arenosum]MBD8079639.1 hypothetical protein [Cellulosimicrobium arenosum]
MSTDPGPAPDGEHAADGADPTFDPAATLRLIREQQDRARAATEPDGRLLYLAWGLSWGVGYLCLYLSAGATGKPPAWAFWVFAGAIVAAVAFTIVHTVTRTAGTRGVSARTGAMYGWSWMLGFLTFGVVIGGLGRAGASDEVIALASNAFACVVVGLLYLGGAAAFQDTRLFVLGVWILVVAAVATFAGLPLTYLVMAALGGGGFLVMGAIEQVLLVRRRARPAPGTVSRPGEAGGA